LISSVAAALLTASLLYLAHQPSNGPNIFTISVLPFYMIGVLFSGNLHQPSEIPAYLSMCLFFFAIVYSVLWIWSPVRNDKHDTQHITGANRSAAWYLVNLEFRPE
jgi:hypothetical protein